MYGSEYVLYYRTQGCLDKYIDICIYVLYTYTYIYVCVYMYIYIVDIMMQITQPKDILTNEEGDIRQKTIFVAVLSPPFFFGVFPAVNTYCITKPKDVLTNEEGGLSFSGVAS